MEIVHMKLLRPDPRILIFFILETRNLG